MKNASLTSKLRMERTPYTLVTEGVEESEQTLSKTKPFWVFFVGSIGIPAWLMGVLVASMGIGFADALFVLLLGNLVGSFFPAAVSILGPKMRLSSMETGRYALGSFGKRIPSFLQWLACIGWDCINNLVAASGLLLFCASFGLHAPLWLILLLLVGIQLLVGVYGHHLVQDTSKYTGILLGVSFAVIGLVAMRHVISVPVVEKQAELKDLFSAFILLVAYNAVGWTTWAADYTRYLPKKTSSKKVFTIIFAPIFLSSIPQMFFGYVTAAAVTDQTPDGVVKALQNLSGHFAPLILLLIGFSSIPINAVNDTSASYSLISTGLKISRPIAAVLGAVLGYGLCLLRRHEGISESILPQVLEKNNVETF